MTDQEALSPLVAPLHDLTAWLQAEQVPAVIIGGVAASLLGRPRTTQDADVLVQVAEESWDYFLGTAPPYGFKARIADAVEFARQSRMLLLQHAASKTNIDIMFAGLPFEEEAIARAIPFDVAGVPVPILSPEDFIVMKASAHRLHDLADIDSVLDAHPKVNLRRIRRWVRLFADAMENPEIVEDLERLLAKSRKTGKRKK